MSSIQDLKNSHKLMIFGGIVAIGILAFWLLNRDTNSIPRANASFVIKKDSIDLSMYDQTSNITNDYKVAPNNLVNNDTSTEMLAEVEDIPTFDYNTKRNKKQSSQARQSSQPRQQPTPKATTNSNDDDDDDVTLQLQKRLKRENASKVTSKDNNDKIFAVIYGDQVVRSSTRVKMRTTAQGRIGGYTIPANTILYGNASFSGNRIKIIINRLVLKGEEALGFNANVYDVTDGQGGIYVKGLDISASAKSSATEVTQSVVSQAGVIGRAVSNAISRNTNQEAEATLFNNTKIIIQ